MNVTVETLKANGNVLTGWVKEWKLGMQLFTSNYEVKLMWIGCLSENLAVE